MAPALRSAGTRDFGARGVLSGARDRTRAALVMGEVAITVALVLAGSQLLGNFIDLLAPILVSTPTACLHPWSFPNPNDTELLSSGP